MIDVLKYLGKKWSDDFNCWDFVLLIYQEQFGIGLCRYPVNYSGDLRGACAAVEIEKSDPVWIETTTPSKNGVVLMGRKFSGWHVGFMVTEGEVIHLMDNAGSIVQSLADLKRQFATLKFFSHASLYPCEKSAETP